ncbi:SH3 domain-containing protein [Streptomyces nanshensis]|uniref:SH3b domain-containing protein n=1 Tax=Streptomyces nanshensis TaxID=518642 RepID=A0A1E7LAT7_9ACTN|nr:SH3 domain-containing protein [Streptomyces nanshensis]OEV13306.1 hypothetical protein AN218_04145 [Streptomyces nanshensis]
MGTTTALRRAAASAATAAAILGGTLYAAPTAYGDDHSPIAPAASASARLVKCSSMYDVANKTYEVNNGGARLRTGPGTSYRTRTVLNAGQKVYSVCLDPQGSYPNWTFWHKVQVRSGHFKYRWGWVHGSTI